VCMHIQGLNFSTFFRAPYGWMTSATVDIADMMVMVMHVKLRLPGRCMPHHGLKLMRQSIT